MVALEQVPGLCLWNLTQDVWVGPKNSPFSLIQVLHLKNTALGFKSLTGSHLANYDIHYCLNYGRVSNNGLWGTGGYNVLYVYERILCGV